MKKIIIMLMVALFAVSDGMAIDLKKNSTIQKGGTRTVSPSVVADLDNDIITVTIDNYYGNVLVDIVDNNGTNVILEESVAFDQTTFVIDTTTIDDGNYFIYIKINDCLYIGSFEISHNQ